MTLAIRIGANSTIYDDLSSAWSQAKAMNQKLSIVGTGDEIKANLGVMIAVQDDGTKMSDRIGSIKATNDLNLSTSDVATNKAALLKLGTKSIVLGTTTSASLVGTNFNDLDAVYSKIKSITINSSDTATPTINVSQLAQSVNLVGIQKLTGRTFNVEGTGADLKKYMNSMLTNASRIGTITVGTSINANENAEFTSKQMLVLGDKLRKTNGGTITLKDTATNVLATSSIATINKLNNTNINANPIVASKTGIQTATTFRADTSFNTGDQVVYKGGNGTGSGDLVAGGTYYARKKSDTTFELFATYSQAIKTTENTGRKDLTGATVGFESAGGVAPIRNTMLDDVKVTEASVAQAKRLVALTDLNGVTSPGAKNRLMSNIVSSVEIADITANLNTGPSTKTLESANYGTTDAKGDITITDHGYATGDAVNYTISQGGSAIGNLVDKTTYYVGKLDDDSFVLYSSRAKALKADLSSREAAFAEADKYINLTAAGVGSQKFTKSDLATLMTQVGTFKDGTGSVGRVTIKGSGSVTALTLSEVANKIKAGNSAAQATYSAKAVDIQNNLQALYENKTADNLTRLTEIVVNDGTATGKKGLTMTEAYYTDLKDLFKEGVDQYLVATPKNKNYTFNITQAAFDNADDLQDDVNVGAYNVKDATVAQLTGGLNGANLVAELSRSKLKTMSSVLMNAAERTQVNLLLNQIGSGPDKAKLKLNSTRI